MTIGRSFSIEARGNFGYKLVARARDVVLAAAALGLGAPVLGLLALVSRVSTGASPFFKQPRMGKNGLSFRLMKFRTLPPDVPNQMSRRETEHLATPLGRVMRRYKLDELPQLWNVLKGDMSLVGPRPIIPEEYGESSHYQRLAVRPGVTGLWQLSRVREEPFDRSPEYDLFYLVNRSITFDFWLIWRTLLLIFLRRQTKIRMAVQLWERDPRWRVQLPRRAKAIPHRTGLLRSWLWGFYSCGAFLAAATPAGVIGMQARGDLIEAKQQMLAARTALIQMEPEAARAALDRADAALGRADTRLGSKLVAPGKLLPGLRGNLKVAEAVIGAGKELVAAGRAGFVVLDSLPMKEGRLAPPWDNGKLDLEPFQRARVPMREVRGRIEKARRLLRQGDGVLLLPQVRETRSDALRLLEEARARVDAAEGAAFLLPRFFGADAKRTWLIGAENTSELRGRGGYIGAFGLLEADKGNLHLKSFEPTTTLRPLRTSLIRSDAPEEYLSHYRRVGGLVTWQNLNASPHFPSGAQLWLRALDRQERIQSQGVLAIDPVGLGMLLELTGEVKVVGIPEPITSQNAADWTVNRVYFEFKKDDERKKRQAEIAKAVWERVVSSKGMDSQKLGETVGRMIAGRHLVVYSADREEQRAIERLGIGGTVEQPSGDYLMLVSNNIGENKLDYYHERKVSYRGEVGADGWMSAKLEVAVTNSAPAMGGLPDVVGGKRERLLLTARRSRSYLTVFVPEGSRLQEVRVGGKATSNFDQLNEFGHRVFATYVELGPGESKTVKFRYLVPNVLVDGRYQLSIQNQATVKPDELSVKVTVPPGAVVGLREGFAPAGNLLWEGPLTQSMDLQAQVSVPLQSRILARLSEALRRPVLDFGR